MYDWSDLANVVPNREPEEKPLTPLETMYFTGSMLEKYEPCVDALDKLIDNDGEDDETWDVFESYFNKFLNFNWMGSWNGAKYDIVLYGMSGYTGYLTLQYLKRVALKRNPEKFTFALAGRTVSKVQELRDRELKGTEWEDVPIIQASYDDVMSMIDLTRSAHCIINVAGPYTLAKGEVLVDACCHTGTHYCDVSGELPWTIRAMELDKHAKQGGALIAPSAAVAGTLGDMLVYLSAKKAREDWGEELRRSISYTSGGGSGQGASGGTLASRGAMNQSSDEIRKRMADPFGLGGFTAEYDRNGRKEVLIEHGTGKVTTKMRKEDNDSVLSKMSQCPYTGLWRGSHVYSFFNTRIVRRSNALFADLLNQPYGKNFCFQEFAMLPAEAQEYLNAQKEGRAPNVTPQIAAAASAAVPASTGQGAVADERAALEAAGKYFKQGEGPPLEDMADAWIGTFMWSQTTSGKEIRCSIVGNDGYFETARCAVEFALCCRFDYDKLPFKGGVLNSVVIGQEWYAKRIIESGPRWKMGGWLEGSDLAPVGFA